jgi:hypothetical protein
MRQEIQALMNALCQAVGNKVYMKDIEKILQHLDQEALTEELQAFHYMARDLITLRQDKDRLQRQAKLYWPRNS